MRMLIELDKRDPKEIGQVIDWVTKDSFWQSVILSPENLRKKWDTITAKMKATNYRPTNKQQPDLKVVTVSDEEKEMLQNVYRKQGERNRVPVAVNE
jgi:hypothetical protein